ncbi:MAG: sugar phosphate nucleotidyltransferase [Kiritimatiellae bacterium]|nr:sugar phosphate nucleotidyltransferase [Kiritimatiellia bacterium]
MKLSLVVLAAGIGSRYGGLKQMDPVGPSGEFIVDYSVYDALRAGFDRVVFVIRREIEDDFRATIGRRVERRAPVTYVRQELNSSGRLSYAAPPDRIKPWGTGHALLVCADAVDGPFGVVNSDDFYGASSYAVLADFLRKTSDNPRDHAMVGFTLRRTLSEHGYVARGICRIDDAGWLVSIAEKTRIEKKNGLICCGTEVFTGDEIVSMNMWGFKPTVFAEFEGQFVQFLNKYGKDPKAEFFIPDVVAAVISEGKGRVRVLQTSESWSGVTYREDKPAVVDRIRRLVEEGFYPENLWQV